MAANSDRQVAAYLSRYTAFTSILAIGFGVIVMAGWAFHIRILKSVVPGQVTAKANTAACFMLTGVALWLIRKEDARNLNKQVAACLALIASTVGLLSYLECVCSWNLGIDQLLFAAGPDDAPGSVRPALMSPITGLSFFSIGLVLLLLDRKTRWTQWAVQFLAAIVGVASMIGILDFVLDPSKSHTHIAAPTAVLLFLLSFALVCARTDWGLGALLASSTLGGTLLRRLFPAAVIMPMIIGWLRWKGQEIGLYSDWAGLAMMMVSAVTLLGAMTAWTAFVIDRADCERQEAEESARRLASIVTSSNDGIIGKNLEGIVTSWNPGAEKIYGYSAGEMIGGSLLVAIPPDRRDEFKDIMERIARGEQIRHFETVRLRKDGQAIQVSLSVSPMRDAAGKIVGVSTVARDITERKQAELALHESEEAFRTLAELVPQLVWMCMPDGLNVYFNQRWVAYTGLTLEESYGRGWSTPFHPEDQQRAWDAWNHAVATGDTYRIDCRLRTADGSYRWFLTKGVPLRDATGRIIKWFGTCTDIDELKRAEEKLREAWRYTRSLIEASLDPLVTISKGGKIMDVNRATELATGLIRDQLIGTDFSSYFTDPEEARAGYERVFAEETVRDYPLVLRHTSGSLMEVLYNASLFKNERGEAEGVFAAARDVTARRKSEQALNRSEKRYRSLVTATSQIVWTTNAQGEVVEDMPSWRAFTGMTAEQILGSGWINSLNPEDRKQTAEIWAKAVQERSVYETEYRIRRKDGEYRMVVARGAPVMDSDGRISEWVGTCTDVTERKRAEEELRLSRERLALAQKAGHSGTFDWNIQNNVNVWTPEVEEVHGLRPGEFAGKYEDWEALVLPEDLPAAKASIEESLKTGEFAGEWRIRRHNDGEIRWVTARAKVMFDDAGKPSRMLGLNMDVTERKQAEEEVRRLNAELEQRVLQRTAQLEAANKELEAFTYSVSHDLRAPLRHISGFSKILTEEYGSSIPAEAQHHLQRIQEGTRRMGVLVDDLLNLGRVGRSELRLQVAGLNSVVNEVVSDLKKECKGREIDWKIGNLPYTECDPSLMKQLFQNLLSNAVKFTRPRPRAVIEVGQKEEDGKTVVFVRDNGVGFSMKYADKLFGVFQRLHRQEDFEGTGVGLATVHRIVQKHGGRIWAEAELDKGATFYFTLGTSEQTEFKTKATAAGDNA